MLTVDIQLATAETTGPLPSNEDFTNWARAAYLDKKPSYIGLRIVTLEESHQLNQQYRQQDKPTNVLSFPMEMPEDVEPSILGDIAICADVVEREALEQKKTAFDHWAHMVVHGVLHLQGYDHVEQHEAEKMESLEVKILSEIGVKNPYLS